MDAEYHESIQITRQFAFCPNAFRIDMYKGCDFGCKYCFANMNWAQEKSRNNWATARLEKIEKLFYRALETDAESRDILIELLRHRVPLHCGGMSDPFQSREHELRLTLKLIELSNKYNYPIMFSTKTDRLDSDYWSVLNPNIHAFQISIMGWDDDFIRTWEVNTPTAKNRLDFVKELRNRGFWCSVRIQPIIDVQQVEKLCYNIREIGCDYVTLEHFKLIFDTDEAKDAFIQLVNNKNDYIVSNHKLQVKTHVKEQNIKTVKTLLCGIPVGVGDNDLHYLSDSRCCCGIDTINDNFSGYLKYNLTYMVTGDIDNDVFIPTCNPRKHINDQKFGLRIDCKQYVDDYIYGHRNYLGPKKFDVEKKLFGGGTKPLF